MVDIGSARTFIHANARVLERRAFAALFEDGAPAGVVDALAGYQNDDGGFGHGLEPDKRVPASQPLDVEIALERLVMVGSGEVEMALRACDWLASVAEPSGAVPVLLPSIASYPRAQHWTYADEYPAGLNPTAAIVAHARALEIGHPWVDRASSHCFSALDSGYIPAEAHALLCVAKLLDQAPDPAQAASIGDAVAAALPAAAFMHLEPDPDAYGVTPLDFAPTPKSIARSWFADDLIDAHLDLLERLQESDGGWPIAWEPPGEAARWEWRGIKTLLAVHTLAAYGRVEP